MNPKQSALDEVAPRGTTTSTEVAELQVKIAEIGLARFVGRINSGLIAPGVGYAAVEEFLSREKQRPFISRLTQAIVGRQDPYSKG